MNKNRNIYIQSNAVFLIYLFFYFFEKSLLIPSQKQTSWLNKNYFKSILKLVWAEMNAFRNSGEQFGRAQMISSWWAACRVEIKQSVIWSRSCLSNIV